MAADTAVVGPSHAVLKFVERGRAEVAPVVDNHGSRKGFRKLDCLQTLEAARFLVFVRLEADRIDDRGLDLAAHHIVQSRLHAGRRCQETEVVLGVLALLAAAARQEEMTMLPAMPRQRHRFLPQVVEGLYLAVRAGHEAGLQVPPLVDRDRQRLELWKFLLDPGIFHPLEDAQLKLVGF